MTVAEAWAAAYIDLPYLDHGRDRAGCDCWGGVRMVMREVFGHELPSYGELYSAATHQPSVTYTVKTGLEECFESVSLPRAGDMVILKIGGRPWHCGIMVSDDRFLHWPQPSSDRPRLGSCIERLDTPTWGRRLGGFYRVRAA